MEELVTGAGVVVIVIIGLVWPVFVQSAWGGDLYWVANNAQLRQTRTSLLWQWPALPQDKVIAHSLGLGNGYLYTPYVTFPCWDSPLPFAPSLPPTRLTNALINPESADAYFSVEP